MPDSTLGKEAEKQIQRWLDKPDKNISFDRIKDQMTGYYGSSNICDFVVYKYPNQYYLESKATWEDRFSFSMLSKIQKDGLKSKNKIDGVFGLVCCLFATQQRMFIFNIQDLLDYEERTKKKSLNIKKLDSWEIPYVEVNTVPNNRRKHLDYEGSFSGYIFQLELRRTLNR